MKALRKPALMLNAWGHRTCYTLFLWSHPPLFSSICLSLSIFDVTSRQWVHPPYWLFLCPCLNLGLFLFWRFLSLSDFYSLHFWNFSFVNICLTFALIVLFVMEQICEKDPKDSSLKLLKTFKTCTDLVSVEPNGEFMALLEECCQRLINFCHFKWGQKSQFSCEISWFLNISMN